MIAGCVGAGWRRRGRRGVRRTRGALDERTHTRYTYAVCRSVTGCWPCSSERPMYGYQLRSEFEARTGGTWPLNVGQVYTTLTRLERDGLVEQAGHRRRGPGRLPDHRRRPRRAGQLVVATPVSREGRPRDELAIKLALAVTRARRRRPRRRAGPAHRDDARAAGLHPAQAARPTRPTCAWLLVLDSLIFQAEAEIRWLDHCEARLARFRPSDQHGHAVGQRAPTVTTPTPDPTKGARR